MIIFGILGQWEEIGCYDSLLLLLDGGEVFSVLTQHFSVEPISPVSTWEDDTIKVNDPEKSFRGQPIEDEGEHRSSLHLAQS